MSACGTTQTRPAPPCAMPHADVVPAPRTSPSPPAGAFPDQVQAPDPAGRPHRTRCQHRRDRSCPQPRSAPSASPTIAREAAATLETAELLPRAGKGDPGAWQEILRRYSGVVHGKIRAFGLQEADALDAVQMTWLRLAENIPQIQHPERLGGWLATTAARECLRLLHQAQRNPIPADAVVDNSADPAPSPEQCVIDAETAQTLRLLVAKLPPRRGRLLRALFTDHPPSYAELSRATGIPLGSIGPTRNRALHQLRQMLEDHQLTPLPAQR
jgi:RNA polymerase sigma factor (sigma-70 family)